MKVSLEIYVVQFNIIVHPMNLEKHKPISIKIVAAILMQIYVYHKRMQIHYVVSPKGGATQESMHAMTVYTRAAVGLRNQHGNLI